MKKIIFYSWQSDLPNTTNRSLIESALKDAAKEITNDESIDVEPVVDRDTQGVPGAPNITDIIFSKIATADIFVADISLVLNGKRRSTPNPNVLIELGYALRALGPERIILVFNEAYGDKEKLPFDLKTRRILIYDTKDEKIDKNIIKTSLTNDFKKAVMDGLSHAPADQLSTLIISALEANAPNKLIKLREHLRTLLEKLDKLQPPMVRDGGTVEQLISSLPATKNIISDFAKISETIVLTNDMTLAEEIFRWFGQILTKYWPPPNKSGLTSKADGDFFRFIGHELFVTFVAMFVKEGRWLDLSKLLRNDLYLGPMLHSQTTSKESWVRLSRGTYLLPGESKKHNRTSFHADLLKERHEKDELSTIIPFKNFLDADYFLSLYAGGAAGDEWYPQSEIWLEDVPKFILEAENYSRAMQICKTLAIDSVEDLKNELNNSNNKMRIDYFPITSTIIDKIGSEGGGKIIMPE